MNNPRLRQIIKLFSGSVILIRSNKKTKYRPQSGMESELDELVRLFSGLSCPVFLVGGVGLAVRQGQFHRNHKDFDISIYTEDMPEIRRFLRERDYRLVRRSFTTRISRFIYIQFYTPFDSRSLRELNRKNVVKLLKKNRVKRPWVRGRLDMIDVLLLGKTDEGVFDYAYQIFIPWKDFLPAEKLSESSSLQLPNIEYKKYLPAFTSRSIDDLEKAGIKPVKSRS